MMEDRRKNMSTVNKMVQYFSENSKNKNLVYEDIVEKILAPEYDNIPEEDWALIIDEVWKMAYKKALSDDVLTPEENYNLEMIRALSNDLRTPGFKQTLRYKLNNYVKSIDDSNHYNPQFKYPKPTPYNWDDDKK